MTKFDFNKQLKIGAKGEEDFVLSYPTVITPFSGHAYDFDCVDTGAKIELKTDTYDMDKTVNFFIERYSDYNKKSPGGPWQSLDKGVSVFCYYFKKNGVWFQFNSLKKLVNRLNKITEGKGLVFIQNRGWTTAGYKIRREDIMDLCDVWEIPEE